MVAFSPNTKWYLRDNAPTSTVGWSAVTPWATNVPKAAGALIRQLTTPTLNNERVFVAIVAGTTHTVTEPTWPTTKGATVTDGAVTPITWMECTGQPGVNGDTTNTPVWSATKVILAGQIIYDVGTTSLQIVSTAGTTGGGGAPAFSGTAGVTTADNTVTWTSLGAASNFGNWAAPFARLATALGTATWGAAGDTCYVGADHAETQSTANMSTTLLGTPASPNQVLCIATATIPPVTTTTGAQLTTTATTQITFAGSVYMNGITFNAGTGVGTVTVSLGSAGASQRYENCTFAKKGTTGSAGSFSLVAGSTIEWNNSTVSFCNTANSIQIPSGGRFVWRNTASAIVGATVAATLMASATAQTGWQVLVEGVDLSAITGTLAFTGTNNAGDLVFKDCKFNASLTAISAAAPGPAGANIMAIRSGSSGVTYGIHRATYSGILTPETTIIRTTGDPVAWKIATASTCTFINPFESFPISIRNEIINPSNRTVTVYGIWGDGAVPNNDDVWMEIVYPGSSTSPQGSRVSLRKLNPLVPNAPLTSDGSTWGGSTTAFKMVATLGSTNGCPQQQLAGYIQIYVYVADATTTVYIDPTPVLS